VRWQQFVSDSFSNIWFPQGGELLLRGLTDRCRVVEKPLTPKTVQNFPRICP